MGIDPSTVATGWALLAPKGLLVASGTIRPEGDVESRINETAWRCGQIYEIHRPEAVYCEEQILSRLPRRQPKKLPTTLAGLAAAHQLLAKDESVCNVDTALALRGLSRAIGFSIHACSARRVQVEYLRPTTWRAAFNCANASKQVALHQVRLLMLSRKVRWEPLSADETEAYGVAEAGRLMMQRAQLAGRVAQ